jgi:hypothetical protein
MDRVPLSPHHRHQASLEDIIFLSDESEALDAAQRSRAEQKFYHIVRHFEAAAAVGSGSVRGSNAKSGQYNRPLLVRLTYEYARSRESQDIFLRAIFHSMALSLESEDDIDLDMDQERLQLSLSLFADHLFDNFFLPCKDTQVRGAIHNPLFALIRHADLCCCASACGIGQNTPTLPRGPLRHPARPGG